MQMRLEGVRGVMLDLDGTVYEDQALIPGPWRGGAIRDVDSALERGLER